jgi:hypothetical protein
MRPPIQPNLFAAPEPVDTPAGPAVTMFEPAPTPPDREQAYWFRTQDRGWHAWALSALNDRSIG